MREKLKLVILEDQENDLELIKYHVSQMDFNIEVEHASAERSFHDAVNEFKPDLIISDYKLDGYNGLLALDYRNQYCPTIPFIVLTGTLGEELAVEIIKQGATDFVLKNKISTLPQLILRALREAEQKNAKIEAEKKLKDTLLNLERLVEERTAELTKSQNQLREALQNEKELGELKTRFVATASHQFRTPMTVIHLNANLIKLILQNEKFDSKNKLEDATNRIEQEIDTMIALIDDILVLGKIDSGTSMKLNKEPVDAISFCEEIAEQFNGIQKDHRKLDLEISGVPRTIKLDKEFMRHSLNNLVSNAFKYSTNGNPHLNLSFEKNLLKIVVSDKGMGIPEDELTNLFSPFHRAKNVRDIAGSGLGLSIAKEYVELNNGTIEVESKLNEGSTFTITLSYE